MPPAPRMPQEAAEVAAFLTATGVPPGTRILDAPCGIGRRAFELAELGYHVTGVDANEIAINALKKRVPQTLADRLVYRAASRDTLPGPPVSERFDTILCLDHALSRGSEEDDRDFLARLRGHLAPAGFLVLDFLHRDFFAARPRPFAYHVLADLEQHEFRKFDPIAGTLELRWRFYQREGEDLRFRSESSVNLRLLSPDQVTSLVERAGWKVDAIYGGWDRGLLSPDRRKFVVVARPSARG